MFRLGNSDIPAIFNDIVKKAEHKYAAKLSSLNHTLRKYSFTNSRFSISFRGPKLVGNKAKRRISKRVFQESKARQNSRKTNISYPLIRTRTCAYQGVRNFYFSEILACFAFLKHTF